MSRTDDAVHRHTVTGQIPMGVGGSVTDGDLLSADGRRDEAAPCEDKDVYVEAVRRALVPIFATSYGVLGAEGCLQELLGCRRKVAKLSRFAARQTELACGLRQKGARLRYDRRRVVSARSVLDRNFLVRARRELVAIQHVHRASRGIDPRFSDTERPGAENDGARSILTRGRIMLRKPLEHIARQLSQPFPDLR